jgi:hypothetical protein
MPCASAEPLTRLPWANNDHPAATSALSCSALVCRGSR